MAWKPGWLLAAAVALAVLAVLWLTSGPPPSSPSAVPQANSPQPAGANSPASPPTALVKPADAAPAGDCAPAPAFAAAARANAASLQTLDWSPFGRPETGWEIYAPLIGREIGSDCGPGDPGFAAALSRWQAGRGLAADGVLSAANFETMRLTWHGRRPFVAQAAAACPPGAEPASLAVASPAEGYGGMTVSLRRDALDAYRRMVAAARAEQPEIAAAPTALTLFSGYRSPVVDGAKCLLNQGCDGRSRSNCSAHRTGLAIDLHVGEAPGSRPDSSDDANRLVQSRTPAYRWLVANAGRFGFAPYVFEPWHWEWTGAALVPPPVSSTAPAR